MSIVSNSYVFSLVGAKIPLIGETDGLSFDFLSSPSIGMYVVDTGTPGNNFFGDPASKLTYTSPTRKYTRRANGAYLQTNSGELPYEWDISGNLAGIRVEEQRTNLLTESTNFPTWQSVYGSSLTGSQVAPDFTNTATLVTADGSFGPHGLGITVFGVTANDVENRSIFVKKNTCRYVILGVCLGSNEYIIAVYDLDGLVVTQTGALGSGVYLNSHIEDVGNGWRRIDFSGSINTTVTNLYLDFASGPTVTIDQFGDENLTTSESFYVWGAQLEVGAFATSYVPTGGGGATRNKDQLTLATSSYPHSDAVGTFIFKGAVFYPTLGSNEVAFAAYGAAGEKTALYANTPNGELIVQVRDNSSNVALINVGLAANTTTFNVAMAYASNDIAAVKDAEIVGTDASATLPTLTTLAIGQDENAGSQFNGYIKQVTYIKRRVSNAKLQSFTGAVALTFVQSVSGPQTTGASSYQVTSFPFGSSSDGELVIMFGDEMTGSDATITSVTCDGVAMRQLAVADGFNATSNRVAIYALKGVTASSGTIVVSYSNNNAITLGFSVYRVLCSDVYTPFDTDTNTSGSGTQLSLTGLTIPPNGAALCIVDHGLTVTNFTWTNATEVDDLDILPAYRHSSAKILTAGTPTITAASSGATSRIALAGVSWAP